MAPGTPKPIFEPVFHWSTPAQQYAYMFTILTHKGVVEVFLDLRIKNCFGFIKCFSLRSQGKFEVDQGPLSVALLPVASQQEAGWIHTLLQFGYQKISKKSQRSTDGVYRIWLATA